MFNLNQSTQLLAASLVLLALSAFTCLAAQQFQEAPESLVTGIGSGDETFTEPIDDIKVAAAESGIVKDIHVQLGDIVEPGTLMIEMDKSVLEASRNIAKSKAESKARLKAAQVEHDIKKVRYEKIVQLLQEGAGSREEVERSRADAEVALQNVEAILEEISQARLEVKRFEAQIERRRVRSPIFGQVVDLRKQIGEHVSTNDPHLITVVQLETLKAVFHIPTSRAKDLRKHDWVQIIMTETGQKAEAIVDYVAPVTRADSGLVRIDVLINNQARIYRSGVRCQLYGKIDKQAARSLYHRR